MVNFICTTTHSVGFLQIPQVKNYKAGGEFQGGYTTPGQNIFLLTILAAATLSPQTLDMFHRNLLVDCGSAGLL